VQNHETPLRRRYGNATYRLKKKSSEVAAKIGMALVNGAGFGGKSRVTESDTGLGAFTVLFCEYPLFIHEILVQKRWLPD
jgi:hypothetical protein